MGSLSRIEKYSDSADAAKDWAEIEAILLMSARQTQIADKQAFVARWTDYYRYNQASFIYVARTVEDRLAGYLAGCEDSQAAASVLAHHAGFALFADMHAAYPAHLHINCRPEYRSQGIGGQLIEAFSEDLRDRSVGGLHVVTAKGARNVRFYQRCGFRHIAERVEGERRLVFLGRDL